MLTLILDLYGPWISYEKITLLVFDNNLEYTGSWIKAVKALLLFRNMIEKV